MSQLTVVAVENADPQREAAAERWINTAYLEYLKEKGPVDDDDLDVELCVQFMVELGRLPKTPQEMDDYVNGKGAFEPGVPSIHVENGLTEQQCEDEVLKSLRRIDNALTSRTDSNYILADAYYHAVVYRLAPNAQRKAKGETRVSRSQAIGALALREFDRHALEYKDGETAKAAENRALRAIEKRILHLVQAGAAMRLIFGTSPGSEIVNVKGMCVARSKKNTPALSWRTISLFFPLIQRCHIDEHEPEEWAIIKGQEEAVRAVHDQLFAEEVPWQALRERILEIRKDSLKLRVAAGDAYAKDALDKLTKEEKKDEAPGAAPAAPPAPAPGVKPTVEEQQARVEAEKPNDEPADAEFSADPTDAAQWAVDAIKHSSEPDSSFEMAMEVLAQADYLCTPYKRAIQGLLIQIKRKAA